ncbi:MAG TPA: hypothetical protein VK654_13220, partial [Nitrospirota bacterium]|nr:hypothetical protein [Nitrospirota bacterium]
KPAIILACLSFDAIYGYREIVFSKSLYDCMPSGIALGSGPGADQQIDVSKSNMNCGEIILLIL